MLPIYNWFPSSLAKANASAEHLSMLLQQHLADTQSSPLLPPSTGATDVLRDWINTRLVIGGLGIADARPEELDALAANPERAARLLAAMISARAHVGWSTRGHSAVDVNVYAHFAFPAEEEAKAELLKGGNMENTDIGRWMARWLRVDDGLLHDITKQLNDSMATDSREGWSQERVQHLAEEHVKAHWG